MKYKTVLITGGAGFVGSNLAVAFKNKYTDTKIIVLDNLNRRGSEMNIPRLKEKGIIFLHGDVRNPEDLELDTKIDLLLECSAEPSVLAGVKGDPRYVINSNLGGTLNCLELARIDRADIIFLSTSRVYPYEVLNSIKITELETRFDWVDNQEIRGWSKEGIDVDFTTNGAKTFYGATKLASELILQEYITNYGLKGVINRCSVIAGPWQFGKVDQGVFTFWMLAHYFKKQINYIGFGAKGKQVRDLLHIDDLFRLIDLQISNLDKINGNVYNVGGGRKISLSLLEATKICQEISGNYINIGKDSCNRLGDVIIYISDNKKLFSDLGWQPKKTAKEILFDIYTWICDNENQILQNLEIK